MNILSLFDGISCGQVALERVGIKIDNYYASEICKPAVQITMKNYPNTIQLGDVQNWKEWNIDWSSIDLLIGGSPCLTADTLVLTSNGYKPIIEVKEGDDVLSHDGKYHKVSAFLEQGKKPTYKIKAMGMDSIRCTSNHKFYVRKLSRKWNNAKRTYERVFELPRWVECKDLDKSYYMGMPINNKSELPNWDGCEYGSHKHKHNELPLDNPNFWYIVGRFLGDGWVRDRKNRNCKYSSVIICCGKSEIDELESKMTVFNYSKVEDRTVFKLQIANKELATFLSNFGHGAGEKFVPGFVMNLPKDLLKSFVDGYLESDGCYTRNKYKGISISRNLIYGMTQCIAKAYNRPFSIYYTKRKPTCIIEGREVNQKDTFEFTFHKEKRKQDKAFYEDGYIWYPVRGIQATGLIEDVYDITVEDSHSFIANNCITHNCQGFSFAGKQLNFEDPRSKLFFEYADILKHIKKFNPKVRFLLENVKMKKEFQEIISATLGVEPVEINSSLVSAQNRKRIYWTNIAKIAQPEDRGILLKDIVHEYMDTENNLITQKLKDYVVPFDKTLQILDKEVQQGKVGYFRQDSQANRVYYIHGKAITLCGDAGGGAAKMGQYLFGCITPDRVEKRQNGQRFNEGEKFYTLTAQDKHGVLVEGYIRKLTPIECERLQTLPDNYSEGISNPQRYRALGNGWTVDVIAHILSYLKENKSELS